MKELSIEEKAKCYDELFVKAQQIYNKENDVLILHTIEDLFPELKESEDERTWIINYLSNMELNSSIIAEKENLKKAIAWLEEQEGCEIIRKEWFEHLKQSWYKEGFINGKYAKQGEQKSIDDLTQQEAMDIVVAKCFEQDEQRPVDKVEPKFKVGDWVVHDMSDGRKAIRQIVNMTNKSYVLDGEDFNTFYFNDLENAYHLWTIQDAKDGDILSDRYSIVIFKGIGNKKWNDVIDYHIGLFTNSQHIVVQKSLSHWGRINEVTLHPATKEQRDLLFQKMHDAGYEWDAEKKELKEIVNEEQIKKNLQDNSFRRMFEEQKSAEKKMDEINRKVFPNHYGGGTPVLDIHNPAWSEEDEEMLKSVIATCELAEQDRDSQPARHLFKMQDNWLKSLKDRVQPQSRKEWSEEDERNIQTVDSVIFYDKNLPEDTCMRLRNWLKSLRPQTQWKPSDEQMLAVNTAINVLGKGTLNGKQLIELREELQKLREE